MSAETVNDEASGGTHVSINITPNTMTHSEDNQQTNFKPFDDGLNALEPQDMACILLPDLDYDSQLIAMSQLLNAHRDVMEKIKNEITKIEHVCKVSRNDRAVDVWLERVN